LPFAARITPQTASTHLPKLTEAGLLSVIREGRHRYFRLASSKVVEMIDRICGRGARNPTALPPAITSSTRTQCSANLLRPPCRSSQRGPHRFFCGARVHRARRRSRGNHASRYAFSHRLRCRPFRTEFDPSPFLPVVPHGRNGDSGAWLLAVRDAPAAAVHRPWTSIDTLRHLAHRISGFRVAFDVIASGDEDVVTTERPEAIRDQLSTLG